MNSHKTTTVTVNSHLLKPYRQAAKILGIPVRQLVEEYLSPFKGEPEQIGEEFRWTCYPKRECALAAAEISRLLPSKKNSKAALTLAWWLQKFSSTIDPRHQNSRDPAGSPIWHDGVYTSHGRSLSVRVFQHSEAPCIVFDIGVLFVAQFVSMGSFWNFRRLPKIPF